MNILWQMDPPLIEHRCLEYQYTQIGRQTYFGRWTPQWIENRCLEYHYTKLGRWTYFGQWTLQVTEQRCLDYQYTKIGRQTYFGQWTPQWIKNRCLEYHYTNLGRWTNFGRWTPPGNRAEMHWIPVYENWQTNLLWLMDPTESTIDALNTSTHNLADEHTLADGPPITPNAEWQFHTATDI